MLHLKNRKKAPKTYLVRAGAMGDRGQTSAQDRGKAAVLEGEINVRNRQSKIEPNHRDSGPKKQIGTTSSGLLMKQWKRRGRLHKNFNAA